MCGAGRGSGNCEAAGALEQSLEGAVEVAATNGSTGAGGKYKVMILPERPQSYPLL